MIVTSSAISFMGYRYRRSLSSWGIAIGMFHSIAWGLEATASIPHGSERPSRSSSPICGEPFLARAQGESPLGPIDGAV